MLNIKTDLGGAESGGLRAQCMLDAGIEKVSLQKVPSDCYCCDLGYSIAAKGFSHVCGSNWGNISRFAWH